jgi:hypothetical protein
MSVISASLFLAIDKREGWVLVTGIARKAGLFPPRMTLPFLSFIILFM